MIYTLKQLNEVIAAAEKDGWRPITPMPGAIVYRGYPLTKRDGQWWVAMTKDVRGVNVVAVSEWVVEPIARLCQEPEPKREEPKSTYWVDRLVLSRCAAGPWKAWPENKPTPGHVYLVCTNSDESRWKIAVYSEGYSFKTGATPLWTVPPRGHVLDSVTHFAELGDAP